MKLVQLHIYFWATLCLFSLLFFGHNPVFAQAISMSRVANSNANLGSPATLKIEKDITIEAWVNPGSPAIGTEAINTVIGNKGNGIATAGFALFINSYSFAANDGRIHFETQGKSVYTMPNAVTPGVWQHIAVSVNGTTQVVNIYVNGVLRTNDVTNPDNGVNITETNLSLRIGSFGNGIFPFIGSLDELRIWNKALSQAEIVANRSKTLSGQDCNLMGYWNFNEGSGSAINDVTIGGSNGTLAGTYAWVASGADLSGGALPPPVGPCLSTWDGTAWSEGKPTANTTATFAGNYNTVTNGNTIVTKDAIINVGNILTIGAATGNARVFNNLTINGTLNNCLGGTVNVTGTTTGAISVLSPQPTTEASGLFFSSVTDNSFLINWTNGNGAKRVVVVKPAVAVNANAAVDGSTYVADANFGGAGSVVDGTGKVVFNGTANTVTVSNLSPNTTYYVAVFEYSGFGCGQNYKTGSPANGSQTTASTTWNGTTWSAGVPNNTTQAAINGNYNTATDGNIDASFLTVNVGFTLTLHSAGSVNVVNTLTNNGIINNCTNGAITNGSLVGNAILNLVEPTIEATGVTITALLTNQFTINWANGNGAKRIIVVKPANAVSTTALTDGIVYTANTNFAGAGSVVDGTGKVVYNGNIGTSITVTGLSTNTLYHVAIFEYNETVCGQNYKTGSPANANAGTLPVAPFALPATNVSPFSFIANWSAVPAVNSYILEISRFPNFSSLDFVYAENGTSGLQPSRELIDLTSNVTYYYRVRAVGVSGQSANSNIIAVRLPQLLAPIALSATQVKSTEFLARWAFAPGGGASYFQIDIAEDANFMRIVAGYNNLVVRGNITTLVKDLKPVTTYYYRVRAVAGISVVNISPNSNVMSVTTLPTPPKAVEALNITTNGFQARWEALEGISSFRLDISSNKDFTTLLVNNATVSGTSFTVANLPIAANYFYRLRAVTTNPVLTSENSNVIEVLPIPVAPVATAATNTKDNVFTANWRELVGADAYLLDASELANFATTLTGFKDLEVKGTSKEITGLKEGKAYYYRLRAFNKSGNSLYSNIIEAITLPSIPQNLNLISATLQQINVSWAAARSELPLVYLIDVATNSSFTTTIIKDRISTATNLSITATFEAGKEYFVRVKARHSRNGESAYSETLVIKMIPAVPLSLVISKTTENSFNLAWGNALGADSYEIEIATNANFAPILRSLTAITTNTDVSNLNSLQQYFCRVRAVNKTGKSGNSATASTITLPNPTTTNKAKNVGSQQFIATWNASTQANTYILEVAKNEAFTDILAGFSGIEISNILERLVSWQSRENELYYRVRVVATVQGQRLVSRPSNIQKVRILLVPFGFRFTNITQTSFDVDWNAIDGAEQYEVSVSLDNFATVLAAYSQVKVSPPSIKLEKLEANRPYQIRVKALSSDGASDNANTAQITLPPFPEEVFVRRLSSTRTTVIEWQYFSLIFSRVSNLRFVLERSDIDGAPFRPISQMLSLSDSRSLRYDDVTGTQRLQATYRLRISNEGGEVIYNIPNRVVTAVEENIDKEAILLYPNPASSSFQLQMKSIAAKTAQINVFDNIGRLVSKWDNIQNINNATFDVSKLSSGKYMLEVIWDKQKIYLPLIKE